MKTSVMGCALALGMFHASAWVNLDFEQTVVTDLQGTYSVEVPGWQHIGANGGDYWNVNMANLSGWAEAYVVSRNHSTWGGLTGEPLAGDFSIGLISAWPDPETGITPGAWDPPPPGDITRAWIGQTGTIPSGSPWLTFITDYSGPSYGPPTFAASGRMTIDFDGVSVGFTLEDDMVAGQPLKRLWADVSAFTGQTGELRIGIEGPHSFKVDNLQFVPEPAVLALLPAALAIVLLRCAANRTPA